MKAKAKRKPTTKRIDNANRTIFNGLADALFGDSLGSLAQVSQADTLHRNNRWYLISNMRQLLSQSYVEHGIIKTVVDVPVEDALRGGIEIKSKQLDEEQIAELVSEMELADTINTSVGQAHKWKRLFGGAGIIIISDQNSMAPLNINAINEKTPIEFRAVDMWELYYDKQMGDSNTNTEMGNAADKLGEGEFYNYYGRKIHKSRVMKMTGVEAPSFLRPQMRGWGLSVVETMLRSINQYLKSTDLTFEVLDEFKIDILKIKGLASTLISQGGDAKIRKRTALAAQQKNYQNMMVMDSEDDYESKSVSFAGISETMEGIRMQIASDLRMPLTKIFGISASGFSSGQDDIENYNAMVESTIRAKAKPEIMMIVKILCKKKFGMIPSDLDIDFKPLRVLSAEQEENVKTQKFSRLLSAFQSKAISVKAFVDGCNRDQLLPVKVDEEDALEILESSETEENVPAAKAPAAKRVAKEAPEGDDQ